MSNSPEETVSNHYLGPRAGFGPVQDREPLVIALFGNLTRAGQQTTAADFDDDQLKRKDQSTARYRFTSRRDFEMFVLTRRDGSKLAISGVASTTTRKLRALRFSVPSNPTLQGNAICVLDKVQFGDHDGHAALGYTPAMQALTDKQKRKLRPLIRADLAATFGTIYSMQEFRWPQRVRVFLATVFERLIQRYLRRSTTPNISRK